MKYAKITVLAILTATLPFVLMILIIVCRFGFLSDYVTKITFLFPLYCPVAFGWIGIKAFKATNKIFPPVLLIDLVMTLVITISFKILFEATERSLADSALVLIFMGPLFYSVPISFIAPIIYKNKNTEKQ